MTTPSEPTDHFRRLDDLKATIRSEVEAAVRQAMTPYALTIDRFDRDIQRMVTTLFGDTITGQKGLVALYRDVDDKLDKILEQRKQTIWMMRGIAAGLGLNLLQTTGWLTKILAFLSS